jgi:hypothetical protein
MTYDPDCDCSHCQSESYRDQIASVEKERDEARAQLEKIARVARQVVTFGDSVSKDSLRRQIQALEESGVLEPY